MSGKQPAVIHAAAAQLHTHTHTQSVERTHKCAERKTPALMRKWKSTYVLLPSDRLAAVICWCSFGENKLIRGSRFQSRIFQECKCIRVGASVLDTSMCVRHQLGSSLICSEVDLPNQDLNSIIINNISRRSSAQLLLIISAHVLATIITNPQFLSPKQCFYFS